MISSLTPKVTGLRRHLPLWADWPVQVKLTVALSGTGLAPLLWITLLAHLPYWEIASALFLLAVLAALTARLLAAPILTLSEASQRLQDGDRRVRVVLSQHDELGQLAEALNSLAMQAQAVTDEAESQRLDLENNVIQLFADLSRAAQGDLVVQLHRGDGALGVVTDSVSSLLQRLSEIVRELQGQAHLAGTGATQVTNALYHLKQELGAQNNSLSRSVSTTNDLAAASSLLYRQAQAASTVSSRAQETLASGQHAVAGTQETITAIRDTARRATRKVKGLGESAQLMGQALAQVQRNTEELHIVAGNASIEAARYADNGGIFRAVANSIEALAEQSQLALRQIQDVVERNQRETVGVIEAIEDIAAQVAGGARTVQSASEAYHALDSISHELTTLTTTIAQTSTEQTRLISDLTALLTGMNSSSLSLVQRTSDSSESAIQLHRVTERLTTSLASLKAG